MKITTSDLKQIVQEAVMKRLQEGSDWSEFEAHLRNLSAYGVTPAQVASQLVDLMPPDKAKMLLKQFLMSPGFDDNVAFFDAFKTMVGEKKAAQALHMILNRAKK